MEDTSKYSLSPRASYEWAESSELIQNDSIHIIGFPFDGTACFRKGAMLGPDEIRNVSDGIESFSPYLNKDLENYQNILDLGNLPVPNEIGPEESWYFAVDSFNKLFKDKNLKQSNIKLLTLGGEHSVSYAPIVKYLEDYSDLLLIHLDAHADLRDGYQNFKFSHASIIRRVLDHFSEGQHLAQYGIRSGTAEEFNWMKNNNSKIESLNELLLILRELDEERPIYLTLDLDFFDPSIMPGTGTPEPGGETFSTFIKILKLLDRKNLVGADIVELAPSIDATGNSSVMATVIMRELLLAMQNRD